MSKKVFDVGNIRETLGIFLYEEIKELFFLNRGWATNLQIIRVFFLGGLWGCKIKRVKIAIL